MASTLTRHQMVRRNDVAVKVDADLVRKAKIVAAFKDVSLAEWISEALRPIVEQELLRHSQQTVSKAQPPKPDPPKRSR